jgi:hypothetical protein
VVGLAKQFPHPLSKPSPIQKLPIEKQSEIQMMSELSLHYEDSKKALSLCME